MSGGSRGALVRLLAAWALFSSCQWAVMVAVSVFAYQRQGASGVAAVTVARLLPAVLAAPVAGLLLDRLDRTTVVAAACAGQTLAVGVLTLTVLDDAPVVAVALAVAAASALGTPTRPALQSILPALSGSPGELIRATAVWSGADSGGFLLGAGLGGLLISVTGPGAVLAVAAGSAAATLLLVLGLPRRTPAGDSDPADGEDDAGIASALTGLRVVVRTASLHAPVALFVGLLLLEGATDVLLVALAIGDLGLGDGGPGLLYAVWGLGGLLGGPTLLVLVRRSGFGRALVLGAGVFGALLAVAGVGGVAVAVAAMVPAGLGFSLVESAIMGLLPRLADDSVLGRVYAVTELMYAGVAALGALLAAPLVALAGIRGGLVAAGLGYTLLTLLTVGRCLRLDRDQHEASRVRDLLHGVPFLSPLPLPLLERLVRSARAVSAPTGTAVVTAGEVGDEFFVIESGEVAVVEYGRRQGPGEGFGEIALLRDVPRTATVRAVADTRLWAVPRAAFLAAVGADGEVGRAAADTVSEHLARPPQSDPG